MMNPTFQPGFNEAQESVPRRAIPFDYAFRYELTGRPGTVLNSTVTVSIEAAFIAVSIGYGVIPKVTPITFGPSDPNDYEEVVLLLQDDDEEQEGPPLRPLREITLGNVLKSLGRVLRETSNILKGETGPEAVLKNGFKLNPDFAEVVLSQADAVQPPPVPASLLGTLFQVVGAPPEQIQFLYAIFDEGSGREFQSDPILNIAGLGISNGDRPFRYFARPITFAARTTIRIEVREVSDFQGTLHVSLHGYKVLGGVGTPTGRIQQGTSRNRRR
jgi:hypothetical protein